MRSNYFGLLELLKYLDITELAINFYLKNLTFKNSYQIVTLSFLKSTYYLIMSIMTQN